MEIQIDTHRLNSHSLLLDKAWLEVPYLGLNPQHHR